MSGITVVSELDELTGRLTETFKRKQKIRRAWDDWLDPTSAASAICAASPLVVAIGADVDHEDAGELIRAIDHLRPEVAIVVLANSPSRDLTLEYMRMGARDVIDPSTRTDTELRDDFQAVLDHAARRISNIAAPPDSQRRRVIAVMSPKGGTGKTTMATNLAVGLSHGLPKQVLLLDLDVQFGDVATALGLVPEHDLADAVKPGPVDLTSLKVFLSRHKSGLAVLSPPDSLARAEEIDADDLKRTIASLSEEFPFVVIDTAAGIDDFSLVALEFATDLLFVSTTDVPSIRAVAKQIEALNYLRITEPKRYFVLNRADAKVGLTQSDIEETLGMKASFTIPSSRVFPLSTNQGVAHIDSGEQDTPAKALREMANTFLPDSARVTTGRRFSLRGR